MIFKDVMVNGDGIAFSLTKMQTCRDAKRRLRVNIGILPGDLSQSVDKELEQCKIERISGN